MFDRENFPKKTNLGFLRVLVPDSENRDDYFRIEEERRKKLIRDIEKGRFVK